MNTLEIFKALSDETRIRIVFMLLYEPLHVNEIIEILDMGQSRISRHLKILMDSEILSAVRDGARIYYGISPNFRLHPLYDTLLKSRDSHYAQKIWSQEMYALVRQDKKKTLELIKKRKKDAVKFFDKFGDWLETTQNEYVDAEYYRNELLKLVPQGIEQAVEPGCGTGWVSIALINKVEKLICIDQSSVSLMKAREKFQSQNLLHKVKFITGQMEELPFPEEAVDLVVYSMALHHTPDVKKVLQEAYRVLRHGGYLLIADLEQHNIEEMRRKFADFWLGFHVEELKTLLRELQFKNIRVHKGRGKGKINCIFIKSQK